MFSLVDASKLTQNMLEKGVIETMAQTSGVLERIPFIEVVGSGYSYNIMSDLPAVEYRQVNTGYNATDVTVDTKVENLVIMGGDADVDVYIAKTYSNINDIRALQTESKAKSVARQFEKDFFGGLGTNGTLKGLTQRCAENMAGTEIKGALSLDTLNELMDSVVDGADVLYMSKKMRRKVMSLLQASAHYIEMGSDSFGRPVAMYGGVAIIPVDDSLIPADRIYAVKFGADQYVAGLSNGGIQVRDLGELDTLPVFRTRIEMYVGLATKHTKCFAILNTSSTPAASK